MVCVAINPYGARVRIHVEKVIGAIRQKYSILSSTLNINMMMCDKKKDISAVDKIVYAALYNCCDTVVHILLLLCNCLYMHAHYLYT